MVLFMTEHSSKVPWNPCFSVFPRSELGSKQLQHSQLAVSNVFWVLRMVSLVNEMEQRLPPALLRSYVVNGSSHGMHRSDDLWTMEYQGVLAHPCITHPMSSGTVNFLVPKLSETMMIM